MNDLQNNPKRAAFLFSVALEVSTLDETDPITALKLNALSAKYQNALMQGIISIEDYRRLNEGLEEALCRMEQNIIGA